MESPIWDTLISSHLELADDIDASNDGDDDALAPVLMDNEEPYIHVDFKPFNFLVQTT